MKTLGKALGLWFVALIAGGFFVNALAYSQFLQFVVFSNHPLLWAGRVAVAVIFLTCVPFQQYNQYRQPTTKAPLINVPEVSFAVVGYVRGQIAAIKRMRRMLVSLSLLTVLTWGVRKIVYWYTGIVWGTSPVLEATFLGLYLLLVYAIGRWGMQRWHATSALPLGLSDRIERGSAPVWFYIWFSGPLYSNVVLSCFRFWTTSKDTEPLPFYAACLFWVVVLVTGCYLFAPWKRLIEPYTRFDVRNEEADNTFSISLRPISQFGRQS